MKRRLTENFQIISCHKVKSGNNVFDTIIKSIDEQIRMFYNKYIHQLVVALLGIPS